MEEKNIKNKNKKIINETDKFVYFEDGTKVTKAFIDRMNSVEINFVDSKK